MNQTIEAWSLKVGDMFEDGATVVSVNSYTIGEDNDARIEVLQDDGTYFDVPYWEILTVIDGE